MVETEAFKMYDNIRLKLYDKVRMQYKIIKVFMFSLNDTH